MTIERVTLILSLLIALGASGGWAYERKTKAEDKQDATIVSNSTRISVLEVRVDQHDATLDEIKMGLDRIATILMTPLDRRGDLHNVESD